MVCGARSGSNSRRRSSHGRGLFTTSVVGPSSVPPPLPEGSGEFTPPPRVPVDGPSSVPPPLVAGLGQSTPPPTVAGLSASAPPAFLAGASTVPEQRMLLLYRRGEAVFMTALCGRCG
ncbi:hypothetical protein Taro_029707 [Colocasia esculenta]|uniref:Uncharacterized protein n=1 Tax=Colocasia esculenta TaxID=4460 RepID=A0A843W123_COLES|nr:hypothetical protein [Colocasia esculenta]